MIEKKYKLINIYTIIIFCLIITAPYYFLSSLLIIPFFIYYEIKTYLNKSENTLSFNLKDSEKNKIKKNESQIMQDMLQAKKIENNILSYIVQAEKMGIKRKKDGKFDDKINNHSARAFSKFLNKEVPKQNKKLNVYKEKIKKLSSVLINLKRIPINRAEYWIYLNTLRFTMRFIILLLFIINVINIIFIEFKSDTFILVTVLFISIVVLISSFIYNRNLNKIILKDIL